jgi:hypothetical protein
MKKLTQSERRRIFEARQAARAAMSARMNAVSEVADDEQAGARWRRAAGVALAATLIGTGLLASQVVEFHLPTSLEAFLPPV